MPKLAQRREHSGDFVQDQAQRLAQVATQKVNDHEDRITAIENALLHGRTSILMQNTSQTITTTQLFPWVIRAYGALTANRQIKGFPMPTSDAECYTRVFVNDTTGGFSIRPTDTAGNLVTLGAGQFIVGFTPLGPIVYSI